MQSSRLQRLRRRPTFRRGNVGLRWVLVLGVIATGWGAWNRFHATPVGTTPLTPLAQAAVSTPAPPARTLPAPQPDGTLILPGSSGSGTPIVLVPVSARST